MERGHNVTAFYTFGKPPEKMLPAKVNVIMAVEQMSLPRDRIADMFWNGVITSSELSNVFMGGSREITAFLHKHSEAVCFKWFSLGLAGSGLGGRSLEQGCTIVTIYESRFTAFFPCVAGNSFMANLCRQFMYAKPLKYVVCFLHV